MVKILLIWTEYLKHVATIRDFVNSFTLYSKNEIDTICIWKLAGVGNCKKVNINLNNYDYIIFNYTIMHNMALELSRKNTILCNTYKSILNNKTKKIFIIQDEYYDTGKINEIIKTYNIDIIFTLLTEEGSKIIYPFPKIKIHNYLAGYISEDNNTKNKIKIKDREMDVFYRGRPLNYWYGRLGQDKKNIGIKMKFFCDKYNIKNDISILEEDRIYGKEWEKRLSNSKVTLATESGSHIFHFDDSIIKKSDKLEFDLKYSYKEAIKELNLKEVDYYKNHISPKMFEAIVYKTALIMFEGYYNDILHPNIHFIELKRDFSNIDEVLKKIKDDCFLQNMVDRTYKEIVESEKYSYKSFIKKFDNLLCIN
tara:strand:- start:6298 stop:7398 length:1101 start_codon:yes stop_codon:yes gene_type:complete